MATLGPTDLQADPQEYPDWVFDAQAAEAFPTCADFGIEFREIVNNDLTVGDWYRVREQLRALLDYDDAAGINDGEDIGGAP